MLAVSWWIHISSVKTDTNGFTILFPGENEVFVSDAGEVRGRVTVRLRTCGVSCCVCVGGGGEIWSGGLSRSETRS